MNCTFKISTSSSHTFRKLTFMKKGLFLSGVSVNKVVYTFSCSFYSLKYFSYISCTNNTMIAECGMEVVFRSWCLNVCYFVHSWLPEWMGRVQRQMLPVCTTICTCISCISCMCGTRSCASHNWRCWGKFLPETTVRKQN